MGVAHGTGKGGGGGIKFEGTEFTGFTAAKDLKAGAICSASFKYANKRNVTLPLSYDSYYDTGWGVFKVSDSLILVPKNIKFRNSTLSLMEYNSNTKKFVVIDTVNFPYNIKINTVTQTRYVVFSDNTPSGGQGFYIVSVANNKINCSALLMPTPNYGDRVESFSVSPFTEDFVLCTVGWSTHHSDPDGGYRTDAKSIGTLDLRTSVFTDLKISVTGYTSLDVYPMDIFFPYKKVAVRSSEYITVTYNPTRRTCSTQIATSLFCKSLLPRHLNPLNNINYFLSEDKYSLVYYAGGMEYIVYKLSNGVISSFTVAIMTQDELRRTPWGDTYKDSANCVFYDKNGIAFASVLMNNAPYVSGGSFDQGTIQVLMGFNKQTLQPLFNERGTEGQICFKNRNIEASSVLLFRDTEIVVVTVSTFIRSSEYQFFSSSAIPYSLEITDDPMYFPIFTGNLPTASGHRKADIMVLEDIKAGKTGKAILLN